MRSYLHQIETHRNQSHSQHQVHRAKYETKIKHFSFVYLVARHDVTKAYRAQGYETEIGPVQELPVFPSREQKGAPADVPAEKFKHQKLYKAQM